MLTFVIVCLLSTALFLCISLLKTYQHVPLKELKRQANSGDKIAQMFYGVANHQVNVQVFFWLLSGLLASGLFAYLNHNFSWPVAFAVGAGITWFGFAWLPGSHISRPGVIAAKVLSVPLSWLLEILYPLLNRSSEVVSRLRPVTVHSGLYTRDDLKELVRQQAQQLDNRIAKHDLDSVLYALTMSDKKLAKVMTPWRKVKLVSVEDTVGPLLLDELHASGHTHFPVYQDHKKHIVGVVDIVDLINAKSGGSVKNVMHGLVYYLNEEDKLATALSILAKTKQPLFIVLNTQESIVGVVSVTDLIPHSSDHLLDDDFAEHDNPAAVAAKRRPKHHETVDMAQVPHPNEAVETKETEALAETEDKK